MSTSVENNQNFPNNQQQQATVILQSNSFAALPFPPTNCTPQTSINTAVYTTPSESSTIWQTSRLPKTKIDKYDGGPIKWNMWYGLSQATVHSKPISDAEKLTHLQKLTTWHAQQAIAGYSCNSAMYATALHELELRLGRPDIIVNNFINKLQQRLQRDRSNRLWIFHLWFAILWNVFSHLDSPTTWTPPFTCIL